MPKKLKPKSTLPQAKQTGRSSGKMVLDPVLNQMVTPKVLAARKKNNKERYAVA